MWPASIATQQSGPEHNAAAPIALSDSKILYFFLSGSDKWKKKENKIQIFLFRLETYILTILLKLCG